MAYSTCEKNVLFGVFYEERAIQETRQRVQKPNFVIKACDSEKVGWTQGQKAAKRKTFAFDCVCVCPSLEAKMDKKLFGACVGHF